MIELGRYALSLALLVSMYTLVAISIGLARKDRSFIESGYRGLYLNFFFYTLAAIALIYAFVTDQFQIRYVAGYSERALPIFYKVTGLWAGQEGSLLFWGWLLALFGAIVIYQNRKDTIHLYLPYVAMIVGVVEAFFLTISVFVTPPFELMNRTPPDGNGLNPLLQNPGMVFHPPALYLGYVGFTIPFAFAMAALITGELDSWWIRKTRRWTIFSWTFLTLGIVFGGWWAYRELGWGGVWGWDPVENSSLMPWLTATAFLHSVMIQERRNMLKVWNMTLILLTFSLSIFGTFLTRSGVVASVHAFGQSFVGYVFIGFLGVVLIFGIILISIRYRELRGEERLEALLSRESTFLYNNLILLGIAFATFWGTIFPILSEAIKGVKISVGPPFFNKINTPLFLAMIVIMGICPLIGWRSTSWGSIKKRFAIPTLVMVLSIGPIILLGADRPMPVFFYAFSVFVIVTTIIEFYDGTRARQRMTGEAALTALGRLISRNRRRYGGYIVHIGIVMMTAGLVGYGFFQVKDEANLKKGEALVVKDYRFVYQGMSFAKKWNYEAVRARIAVFKGDRQIGTLFPEKRFYTKQGQPTTEVAIRSGLFEDLYLILTGWNEDGSVTIVAIVDPLLQWIWIGTGVATFGAIFAVIPRRKRAVSTVPATEREEAVKA